MIPHLERLRLPPASYHTTFKPCRLCPTRPMASTLFHALHLSRRRERFTPACTHCRGHHTPLYPLPPMSPFPHLLRLSRACIMRVVSTTFRTTNASAPPTSRRASSHPRRTQHHLRMSLISRRPATLSTTCLLEPLLAPPLSCRPRTLAATSNLLSSRSSARFPRSPTQLPPSNSGKVSTTSRSLRKTPP